MFYILFMMITIFAARINDGDEMNVWTTTDYLTGNSRPLRADCWFQDNPETTPILSTGICINIWNLAKVRFLTHSLAGGGNHKLGYCALKWETILHGNADELGKYAVLSVLPDKTALFLYEYRDISYILLHLPLIPLDRSGISAHGILHQH